MSRHYPKTCDDKIPLPREYAEKTGSFVEGNQAVQHSILVKDHQGGQVPGSQWGTSLHSGVLHTGHPVSGPGVYVPRPTFTPHNPPPSHLHLLYTTNNKNKNNTLISHKNEGTFTCDGVVYPVLASQPSQPSQLLPLAQAPVVPLMNALYDPTHAPLAVPYSLVPLTQELYAPPPHGSRISFSPAIDSVTAGPALIDIPEGPIPENLMAMAVANTVRLLAITATRVGNRFFCPIVGCPKGHVGSKDSLKHHLHRIHFKPSKRLQCPEAGCNITFGYYLELNRHHDQLHKRIGHVCECTGQWYRRLETLKKRCRLGSKCPSAVDRRATGAHA